MKPGETLDDYLSRFNKILSDLRSVDSSYDANYPQSEISRHFLNGLDMSIWEIKVTSIQESVNMSTLTLDSLYTKLKTHEMNVLSQKVDSRSSALVSSSSSLDVDASSSKSSFLAVFNATSDDQLEQIEEEDLALVANRIARAMNNARNRKSGGPNRCFECGSIDHLRSLCPKLGRGKREDKDGEKTNNNKPNNNKSKGSSQGRKLDNLRKAFQQLKQPHDVLDCSTCNLNKMKLKDALGRVKFMEDVVKNNEVLSCPKCRKSKGVMVDCENCANFEKEVSYLKNYLLRFSNGKKNLNMILDQSKVSTHNRGLGFNPYAHNSRYPPVVLGVGARCALAARKDNVWIVDSSCSRHKTGDKNWFSSLKKASMTESIIFGDAAISAVLATGMVKVNEKFELKNVALVEDLKYNLLSVSQIVDENFEVHFKKSGSKVFDSCGDSVLNISRYGRVFKADFDNPVSPVITCLVAKFDKDVMFWHYRLGHVGFDHLTWLSGLDLVRGLPKLKKDLDLCFVLKSENLDKFEACSTDGLFLGYPAHTRGYRVLILGTNKIVETCEVSFDEASPGLPITEGAAILIDYTLIRGVHLYPQDTSSSRVTTCHIPPRHTDERRDIVPNPS
uniref:Transposon protein, putative, unclassified n=1 Tax=Oryza sativa subsp. japonica TaxID=39947 RepID=Q2QRS3_ORYSJ|nr:transposon protein, putative, unclassified [Oryza sativa Japonica Group]